MSELRPLYPPTEPYRRHWLDVGDDHRMLVREFGSPDGLPVVAIHGGPGSGKSMVLPRFFDPARYRIICPDQRGSGGSEPGGEIAANDTEALVADLTRLRRELGIERWLVVGGSWGATLALCHAAADAQAVSGILLRGSFLARDEDLQWFFQGAREVRPRSWARFAAVAPPHQRQRLLDWLGAALVGASTADRERAAHAWSQWEAAMTRPAADDRLVGAIASGTSGTSGGSSRSSRSGSSASAASTGPEDTAEPISRPDSPGVARAVIDRYRVQVHFLLNGCWLRPPDSLLARCSRVPAVPILMLHGTEDVICRPEGATTLYAALPAGTRLRWIEGAGHDPTHPALADAMVRATDAFLARGRFDDDGAG